MKSARNTLKDRNGFHLNKWFLDCVTDEGEAWIFYAAELRWHGLKVPYTSSMHYTPNAGTALHSRFRRISMPEKSGQSIHWQDVQFGVSGSWKAAAPSLKSRLVKSEDGYLDWNCLQPMSKVEMNIDGRIVEGSGYAEQLIMTIEPWKIPMDELRWGRYTSGTDNIVWIELRGSERQQWLWLNDERLCRSTIEDDQIVIPEKGLILELKKDVVLESEKKILNVVKRLLRFVPGFNRSMPSRFLNSDESKWLSQGVLRKEAEVISTGWAIHECVRFED